MSEIRPNVYWEETVVTRDPQEYADWCAENEDYLNDEDR